jgi:single-stranded-DNA-specific exonuclease
LDEIAYAASHGIDVVVTDHHQPGVRLPDAAAVVDPNRADCPYPFKGLSGVGVAFKLAHALARELGKPAEESRAFLRSLMDLVALGTVTDIVPLVGENRILVAHGLKVLAATERVGLQALIQGLGFSGKAISGDTVGFLIGPRLNAAGRTEDARYGLELLLTRDDKEARRLADYLDELNQQRRRLENVAFEEALRMIESEAAWLGQRLLVAAGEGWHPGVLGIVASRLVDRFHRPSVVLSIEGDHAKGSARSTGHFNIHEALHACEALLSSYGGHKMAAGLTLTKKNVGPLREALNAVASRMMTEADLVPRLVVDTAARIDEMTLEALEQINRMRPFGEGNPSPVVALMGCRLAEPPQMKKGKHLKLRLAQPGGEGARQALSICAMGFGAGSRYNKVLRSGEPFDLAGAPTVNEWNGNRTVELTIRDIRPAATH